MKFSASLVSYLLSAAVLVAATPMDRRPYVKMLTKASARSPDGAVYFITNQPDENMVISASIHSDGTLRLDRAVAAGGRGLHGNTTNGNTGSDGLFSQSSITVSAKNNVLATVNAGSSTVSLFSIDPRKPTNINPIGDPISSEGEFPMSVAFNGDGSRLCVLNGGVVNGVICYKVDKTNGLTPLPNTLRPFGITQTTPPFGPPNTVSQIMFSEDDKTLLASYKGTANAPGYIASWDVAADGSLSSQFKKLALPGGGITAFGMTPVRGQNAVFVTDPGRGFEVVDMSGANRGTSVAPQGERASCWASYSAFTKNYYATDAGGNAVREVSIDSNLNMKVIGLHNVTANATSLDTQSAVIRNKGYLYVLGAQATSVEILALEAPGQSKLIASVDVMGPARAAGVEITAANIQGMATYVRQ